MKKRLLSLMAIPLLLFGCSNDSDVDTNEGPIDASALMVDVDILTPEEVSMNEPIELAAKVTQNNEAVDDAEAVQFEVWESGYRDKGEILDGVLKGDGVYHAEFTFDHEGVYFLYAHTTARGLHVMPKQQIVVGNPDLNAVIEDKSGASMDFLEKHEEEDSSHLEDDSTHSEEDLHESHSENPEENVITIE